ncbi:MAG: hypothetical protein AB7F28_06470 [Candidatus Margulisiibacteriota bacterium]
MAGAVSGKELGKEPAALIKALTSSAASGVTDPFDALLNQAQTETRHQPSFKEQADGTYAMAEQDEAPAPEANDAAKSGDPKDLPAALLGFLGAKVFLPAPQAIAVKTQEGVQTVIVQAVQWIRQASAPQSSYLFRVVGQDDIAVRIDASKKNSMKITVYLDDNLKKELSANLKELMAILKKTLDEPQLDLQVERLHPTETTLDFGKDKKFDNQEAQSKNSVEYLAKNDILSVP